MMTEQILALLIAERDKLNQAIAALSGETVTGKRRGHLPKNPLAVTTSVTVPAPLNAAPALAKGRRKFTAAHREAAAERMRQRWAAKKKAEAKSQPKVAGKSKK